MPLGVPADQFRDTKQRIDVVTGQIKAATGADEIVRCQTLLGVGPIITSALAATVSDLLSFRSARQGRDLHTQKGLTPTQRDSIA